MQINIKTYDEARESRVSVEVPEGQRFDIELDGEYRITNRGLADSEVSTDLVEDRNKRIIELNDMITEMHRALASSQQAREIETKRADEAEAKLKERTYMAAEVGDLQASEAELVAAPLRRKVGDLRKKLDHEIKRADANQAWAERAEARVDAVEAKLGKVRQELTASGVKDAQEETMTVVSKRLSGAIREAVNLIDQA